MTASSVYKAPKRKLEISFGGCGFLGVYHVGVGKCVVDHVPHLFDEFSGFYGASAGAITAVCAACKSDPMVPYKWVKKTFEASREYKLLGVLHPRFDLYERLREFLEGFLPENAHKLCRNKVKISLTIFNEEKTLPKTKNWLVSNFTTRNELINVSTFIHAHTPHSMICHILKHVDIHVSIFFIHVHVARYIHVVTMLDRTIHMYQVIHNYTRL